MLLSKLKYITLVTLLLFFAAHLKASSIHNKVHISNYENIDFQGAFSIKSIFQDSIGNLFASTDKGMYSYNGMNWKRVNFSEGEDLYAFLNTTNNFYAAGSKGLGTIKKIRANTFAYMSIKDSLKGLDESLINASSIISKHNNTFIFYENRIVLIAENEKKYTSFYKPTGKAIGFSIGKKIFFHQKGLGLNMIYNNSEIVPYLNNEELESINVIDIKVDNERIYLFTQNDGIHIYEDKVLQEKIEFNYKIVSAENLSEQLWAIATENSGVIIVEKRNGKTVKIIDKSNGLENNNITDICVDIQKNIWIGSKKGLQKAEVFIPFSYHIGSNQISGRVTDIEFFNNKLVVATTEGIYREDYYDELHGSYSFSKMINQKSSFSKLKSLDNLLLVTDDNHINYCDSSFNLNKLSLFNNGCIIEIENKAFMTYSNDGITFYKNCEGIECEISPWLSKKVYNYPVNEIVKVKNDSTLVIRENDLLYFAQFQYGNGIPKIFNKQQIQSDLKFTKLIQNENNIFAITKNKMFAVIPTFDDFDFIECDFVQEDTVDLNKYDNYLFEETMNFSLLILNNKSETKAYYKLNDDFKFVPVNYFERFPKGEIHKILIDDTEVGKYWLCNENGLINYFSYDLHNAISDKIPFKTLITKFPLTENKETSITYSKNTVQFEYSSTNLIAEQLNQYSFFLEGFSDSWSGWSNENTVTFANLYEGDYVFNVKSKNIYQNESEVASFNFSIAPPWYRTFAAYVLYGLILAGVIFVFVRLNVARLEKANDKLKAIIEERTEEIRVRKEELEEKNKDITASIEYARTIQDAILTSSVYLKSILNDYFIYYKPKDIIGGDFYWAYRTPGAKTIVAVADCTGHGVPGALMSMIGNSLLNEIIIENQTYEPNLILDHLRAGIINSFQNNSELKEERSHDGMDISIISIGDGEVDMEYASAKHTVYVVRDKEMIETHSDFQPISNFVTHLEPYNKYTLSLQKNDVVYLCSDGYADQFGGQKGKKFMQKKFRDLLKTISTEPMEIQQALLEKSFEDWKEGYEQIDDVCVLGVRVV